MQFERELQLDRNGKQKQRSKLKVALAVSLGGILLLGIIVYLLYLKWTELETKPWQEISCAEGNCKIQLPRAPVFRTEQEPRTGVTLKLHELNDWRYSFAIVYGTIPADQLEQASAEQRYDSSRNAMLAARAGAALVEEKKIAFEDFPGRQFTIKIPFKGNTVVRTFLVGNRFYLLAVGGYSAAPDAPVVRKFFDSFTVDVKTMKKARQLRDAFLSDDPEKVTEDFITVNERGSFLLTGAYLPGDKSLVSVTNLGRIDIWDLESGKSTATLKGHDDSLEAAVLAPDGKTLATTSRHGIVQLLDVARRRERTTLQSRTGFPVAAVSFSQDGRWLAAIERGNAKLWDIERENFKQEIDGSKCAHLGFSGSAISSDGKILATTSESNLWLWNTDNFYKPLPEQRTSEICCLCFAPDGQTMTFGQKNGSVVIWRSARQESFFQLEDKQALSALAYSPDGKYLAVGCENGSVQLWVAATCQRQAKVFNMSRDVRLPVVSLSFSSDGKSLAVARQSRINLVPLAKLLEQEPEPGDPREIHRQPQVRASNLNAASKRDTARPVIPKPKPLETKPDPPVQASAGPPPKVLHEAQIAPKNIWLPQTTRTVRGMALSADGELAATWVEENIVRVWDLKSGQERFKLETPHQNIANHLEFSPDGKLLLTDSSGEIKLWDTTTGAEKNSINVNNKNYEDSRHWYSDPVFSGDGKLLAAFSPGLGLVFLDVPDLRLRRPYLNSFKNSGRVPAFAPNGRTVAAAGSDDSSSGLYLKFWDIASEREIAAEAHKDFVSCVLFSPNSTIVATCSSDKTICLWDPSTGQRLAKLEGHPGVPSALAFSLDGKTLASCCYRELKLWDVATCQERIRIEGTFLPLCLRYHPDGKRLLVGTRFTTVKVFELAGLLEKGKE